MVKTTRRVARPFIRLPTACLPEIARTTSVANTVRTVPRDIETSAHKNEEMYDPQPNSMYNKRPRARQTKDKPAQAPTTARFEHPVMYENVPAAGTFSSNAV